MDEKYFEQKRNKAKALYESRRSIFCPYFNCDVVLNSDGFHHLQFSARRERSKEEQVLKFDLFPLGLKILRAARTLQEYRRDLISIGKKSKTDGMALMKTVEYWGFWSFFLDQNIKVRIIVRRVGNGNYMFWSVMPYEKLNRGGNRQRLYTSSLGDD